MNHLRFYIIIPQLVLFTHCIALKAQDSLVVMPDSLSANSYPLLPVSLQHSNQEFNFQSKSLKNKLCRAAVYSSLYNASIGVMLVSMSDEITQWHKEDKFKLQVMLNQYKETFTKTPVFDKDLWFVNYLGHPYQGSCYFNSIRSQGANFWTSSLFCLGQSLIWEYAWEGGMEQPSIQDLLVTPIVGSLIGEFAHKATLTMRKNGFRWYEKITICLLNPSYVINNGFRTSNFRK